MSGDRDKSSDGAEAVAEDHGANGWWIAGVRKAMASIDAGKSIPHQDVREWVESWGRADERPAPKP